MLQISQVSKTYNSGTFGTINVQNSKSRRTRAHSSSLPKHMVPKHVEP